MLDLFYQFTHFLKIQESVTIDNNVFRLHYKVSSTCISFLPWINIWNQPEMLLVGLRDGVDDGDLVGNSQTIHRGPNRLHG